MHHLPGEDKRPVVDEWENGPAKRQRMAPGSNWDSNSGAADPEFKVDESAADLIAPAAPTVISDGTESSEYEDDDDSSVEFVAKSEAPTLFQSNAAASTTVAEPEPEPESVLWHLDPDRDAPPRWHTPIMHYTDVSKICSLKMVNPERSYRLWRDANGRLESTFGALIPEGYALWNNPSYPWICPVRDCRRLCASRQALGGHFIRHRKSLLNDNRDGTFTVVGTYAEQLLGERGLPAVVIAQKPGNTAPMEVPSEHVPPGPGNGALSAISTLPSESLLPPVAKNGVPFYRRQVDPSSGIVHPQPPKRIVLPNTNVAGAIPLRADSPQVRLKGKTPNMQLDAKGDFITPIPGDAHIATNQPSPAISANRAPGNIQTQTPAEALDMEGWEVGPGRIRSKEDDGESIAFSNAYLFGSNGSSVAVADGISFHVDVIRPGTRRTFERDSATTRICSLASGKLKVRMQGEDELTLGTNVVTEDLGTVFPTPRRRSPPPVTEPPRTQSIPAQSNPQTTPARSSTASPIRREQIRIIRDPLPIRPPRPFCPATSHIIVSLQRGSSPVQPPHGRPESDSRGEGSLVLYRPPLTPTQQPTHRQQPNEAHTHQWAAGSPRPPTRDTTTPTIPNCRDGSDHARQSPPEHRQETPPRVRSPHATAGRPRASMSPSPASIIAAFPAPPCCPPPPEWIREQAAAGNPAWMSSMSDSGPGRRSLPWKRLKRWGERVRGKLESLRSRRAKLRGKGKASGAEGVDERPMSDPPPQLPRPCSSIYSTASGTYFPESEGRASAAGVRLSWPRSSRPPVGVI
ncbi:hypothetical protein PspLS_03592 [Pyricularia sp. CBS 133598]|nr:hypothetical protein PspLS_03592 [Pyricularia sp. CBS 133598]